MLRRRIKPQAGAGSRVHGSQSNKETAVASGSFMGNAVLRREDPDLLTGTARYVGDMAPPGTVHLAFVRSVMAHAGIAGVDTEAAKAAPGVLDVLTASDLPIGPQPGFVLLPAELSRRPLADKARYVGDPIAVVVAETRAEASTRQSWWRSTTSRSTR